MYACIYACTCLCVCVCVHICVCMCVCVVICCYWVSMKLSHSVTRCLLTTCCCRYNSVTVFYCASVSGASTPRCYTLCHYLSTRCVHYLSARCVTLSIITCQSGVMYCLSLPVSQVCYTVSHCLSTRSAVHCKRFIPSIGNGRHR